LRGVRSSFVSRAALALLIAWTAGSCQRRTRESAQSETPAAEAVQPEATGAPASSSGRTRASAPAAPVPAEIWKEFSGERAFAHARIQVQFGPRPSGSRELEKAREQIRAALRGDGWEIEEQPFTGNTPRAPIQFVNIIARHASASGGPALATTQQAIVCSHYDTKRFTTIKFVGANDGASSTGALLELARVLAKDPALAAKVELVFFDGEEAVAQFSETDGLYGSRYYARRLREQNRAGQFKFGILWDMIGDKDLTITCPPDSPQPLTEQIFAAADALGLRAHFGYYDRSVMDDHVPLNEARIPTVDLIDFDYFPWHTADDTLDKLDAESLRKVGAVTLYHLRQALKP
jgi:hypothetical protein